MLQNRAILLTFQFQVPKIFLRFRLQFQPLNLSYFCNKSPAVVDLVFCLFSRRLHAWVSYSSVPPEFCTLVFSCHLKPGVTFHSFLACTNLAYLDHIQSVPPFTQRSQPDFLQPLSSYLSSFRPLTSLTALVWILSRHSLSCSVHGDQTADSNSRCCLIYLA